MNLLDGLKQNTTITNDKGSEYYETSYDSNLDVFTKLSRYNDEDDVIRIFDNAFNENKEVALANLLYILDIRNGKGERRLFKIIYKYLCEDHPEDAIRILPFISNLGRYDYILESLDTEVESAAIELIKNQLEADKKSDTPSLLAKWLPTHRTHNRNNQIAKKLTKLLNMREREYRKLLTELRTRINIIEKNLTDRNYDNIDFAKVPAKAMLKYTKTYEKNMKEKYDSYKTAVTKGEEKINTTGLFSYEIIKKLLFTENADTKLCDLMWENQKEITGFEKQNLLVVADTSGSMTSCGAIPYCTSLGLAAYIAERNKGFFKNHFITFSDKPALQEIKGKTLSDKLKNFKTINVLNTDIDKVFDLLLDTAITNKLNQSELPSHLIIISDMEFDRGVQSNTGTNFSNWKKKFEENNYKLPIIIFWNVAGKGKGLPVTKFDEDVAMVSGFSTSILENLLSLDKYTPLDMMQEKIAIYLEMLK